MVIRGAPAIGVAAAMGIALGMRRSTRQGHPAVRGRVPEDLRHDGRDPADRGQPVLGDRSDEARRSPTARRPASRRGARRAARARGAGDPRRGRRELPGDGRLRRRGRARRRARADALQRRRAGDGGLRHGARRDPRRGRAGQEVAVFADETRPFLQGARLTAWELVRDGIDTTVITESMAGPLMRAGDIDIVVVGADRIAANGDTANKIGTYTVAVLAHEHKRAVLRRGAALDDRSGDARRRAAFRSRSATSAR